jgi:hypothetical protein
MIGTAITSQPERTGPDWFGKVATRALSPLEPRLRIGRRRDGRPLPDLTLRPRAGALTGPG